MAKFKEAQQRFLSGEAPKLRVNLKEIFGVNISNEAVRQKIGQVIIDRILTRAESGKDVNGKKFKAYSKAYKQSDDFKAFDKESNKVNLRLTGDMLDTMDITDTTRNTVTISWEDSEEGQKALGHIKGGGNLPVRDFFGLNKSDIDFLRREFKAEAARAAEKSINETLLLNVIDRLTSDGES